AGRRIPDGFHTVTPYLFVAGVARLLDRTFPGRVRAESRIDLRKVALPAVKHLVFPVTFVVLAATYEYERKLFERDARRPTLAAIRRGRSRGVWENCRKIPIPNLLPCI